MDETKIYDEQEKMYLYLKNIEKKTVKKLNKTQMIISFIIVISDVFMITISMIEIRPLLSLIVLILILIYLTEDILTNNK